MENKSEPRKLEELIKDAQKACSKYKTTRKSTKKTAEAKNKGKLLVN